MNINPDITIIIEIDGKVVDYEGFLEPSQCILGSPIGGVLGTNGLVKNNMICEIATSQLWGLGIYGDTDADYWHINGVYKSGEWDKGNNGEVIYRVSERLI